MAVKLLSGLDVLSSGLCLTMCDTLCVESISHKEKIDTDTPAGKFMLTVFAALSQPERKQLKQ